MTPTKTTTTTTITLDLWSLNKLLQISNIDRILRSRMHNSGDFSGSSDASIASQYHFKHKSNPYALSGCPQTPCSVHTGVV